TPAARALTTDQCGSGCVSGTPGASTSAAKRLQSAPFRSSTRKPAAAAAVQLSALSSAATTAAPPAASARQVASPERPRPNTATVRPANVVIGVIAAFYPESVAGSSSAGLAASTRGLAPHHPIARGSQVARSG